MGISQSGQFILVPPVSKTLVYCFSIETILYFVKVPIIDRYIIAKVEPVLFFGIWNAILPLALALSDSAAGCR